MSRVGNLRASELVPLRGKLLARPGGGSKQHVKHGLSSTGRWSGRLARTAMGIVSSYRATARAPKTLPPAAHALLPRPRSPASFLLTSCVQRPCGRRAGLPCHTSPLGPDSVIEASCLRPSPRARAPRHPAPRARRMARGPSSAAAPAGATAAPLLCSIPCAAASLATTTASLHVPRADHSGSCFFVDAPLPTIMQCFNTCRHRRRRGAWR